MSNEEKKFGVLLTDEAFVATRKDNGFLSDRIKTTTYQMSKKMLYPVNVEKKHDDNTKITTLVFQVKPMLVKKEDDFSNTFKNEVMKEYLECKNKIWLLEFIGWHKMMLIRNDIDSQIRILLEVKLDIKGGD